jgi:alpha-tubulin suppressor-like RCC1 family protein
LIIIEANFYLLFSTFLFFLKLFYTINISNAYGQLGTGNFEHLNKLTEMPLPKELLGQRIDRVSCGAYHTLVFTEKNEIFGCGLN